MGRELEAVTGKMAELADAYRGGTMSGMELGGEIIREIPIFGNLVKTVDNVKEAFTGEAAAAKLAQGELVRHIKANKEIQGQLAGFKKAAGEGEKSLEQMVKGWGRESDLLGTPEKQRDKLRAQQAEADMLADVQTERDKIGKELEAARAKVRTMERSGQAEIQKDVYWQAQKALEAQEHAQERFNKKAEEAVKLARQLTAARLADLEVEKNRKVSDSVAKDSKRNPGIWGAIERYGAWYGGKEGKEGKKQGDNFQVMQSPNPAVAGVEMRGAAHIVTAADVPQPYRIMQKSLDETAASGKKQVGLLGLAVQHLAKMATAGYGGNTPVVMEMPG
jgi:hypothetical protein